MKEEIWKDIPGYETFYQASNLGRIRSVERKVPHRHGYCTRKSKIINGTLTPQGYISYRLANSNKTRGERAHRLIISAFHGKSTLIVDHINGKKTDNRLVNLRYCTSRMNNIYARELALDSISKFVGVSIKRNKISPPRWRAYIKINKKFISLGCYKTKEDASEVYRREVAKIESQNKLAS